MKFTLSWLKEYLDTNATLDEIAVKLTDIGLEVEGIEDPAKTLKGFVVGEVLSAEKHPDADKLQCLIVDTGTEKLKVVCGAPNARAGMKGVFAPSGSYIPGSDITLKKSMIRGQESNGMMCSERELLLSEEHNGIIDLPASHKTGSPAADALGLNDPVIEINLTPNRGDCAGIYGIARDLAAAGLGKLKSPDATPVASTFDNPIQITGTTFCPLFIGRYIKGVKNSPSPEWLQKKLKAVGIGPISALVDITNYLTIGYSRPAHVFDADKIKGNIHIRFSKTGEKLAALNGNTYDLDHQMPAVCDDVGVLGLGGVIGGEASGVSDATTNVYLEIAVFDPSIVAYAGRKLSIDTDARYRFERGVDRAFAEQAAEIATKMIIDLCGGTASKICVAALPAPAPQTVNYAPQRLKSLGGLDLPEVRQKEILEALGFAVKTGKTWEIGVPSWRHDVQGEPDIVEEILRINGYDSIPAVQVRAPEGENLQPLSPETRRGLTARRTLATRGMLETITYSFMDEATADLFGMATNENRKSLILTSPLNQDFTIMRPSILPNLIAAAGRNTDRGHPDACIFEIGRVFKSIDAAGQIMTASGLRSGNAAPRHWSGAARAVDAFDVKADALAVLESCGVNVASLQITTEVPAYYHPGRSGAMKLGRDVLAYFGEIHPAALIAMKREETYAGFEVFLPALPVPKNKGTKKDMLKLSAFQPLRRDFAFIVDEKTEAEKLLRAIRGTDKTLITAVDIFDVYQGKGVEPGKKSLALGVTIQPMEKTLTDEEINALCQKIIEAVQKQTGAVLRA